MDELLIGYALQALSPSETAAVEAHLQAHPEDFAKLERYRQVLAPLETDRDAYTPPAGLVHAVLARVAETIVGQAQEASATPSTSRRPVWPQSPGDVPVYLGRRPIEVFLAAGIAFLAFGLVLAGAQKIRHNHQIVACQNNLRLLYQGLTDYADAHDDRYPQVGEPHTPTAGSFAKLLVETGYAPSTWSPACPAGTIATDVKPFQVTKPASQSPDLPVPVDYAYTLGYRTPEARLIGPRRGDRWSPDNTPLAADLPAVQLAPTPGPVSAHGRGQNVLFVDGRVQFVTVATVGPSGDDIYRNDAGLVRAGLQRFDATLGRPHDVP